MFRFNRLTGTFAAVTVLFAGGSAAKEAAAPAAPAERVPAFQMDEQLYGRLVVTVTYDEGPNTEINRCPKTVYDLKNFGDLLEANRNLALGVAITTPENTQITLEPTSIEIKPPRFLLGKPRCTMRLDSATYMSPLYALSTAGGASFTISPSVRLRDKPPAEMASLAREVTSRVMALHNTTAPFADSMASAAWSILDESGTNVTASRARPFPFRPSGRPTELTWTTTISLDPRRSETIPVMITARFENMASIFSPTATTLEALNLAEPDLILGHRLLPTTATWVASSPSIETQLSQIAPEAYRAFVGSNDADGMNSACNELGVALNTSGFSPTDRAVILWALAQRRGDLGGTARGDQIGCLQERKALLKKVGVTLRPVPEPEFKMRASTTGEMKAAIGSDTGDADNLVSFFKTTERRSGAAAVLFRYPLTLNDPSNVLLPADRRPVEHRDTWLGTLRPAEPFFIHFGCYRYDAAGKVFARARSQTNGQTTDYSVELTFTTPVSTAADGSTKIGDALVTEVKLAPRGSGAENFACPS